MEEWIENTLIVLGVIIALIIIWGGVFFLIHFAHIDYNEDCMRKTAVRYCDSKDMYFNYYQAGSIDNEYFRCIENERGSDTMRFEYSGEELDYCMNKDANKAGYYKITGRIKDSDVDKYHLIFKNEEDRFKAAAHIVFLILPEPF